MRATELPIPSHVGDLDRVTSCDPNEVTSMVKSFVALSILALLGASVIALPYASRAEAGEKAPLAKGDRLDIRPDCSQEVFMPEAEIRRW